MPEVFHVSLRQETGTRNMHRLRRAGKVPAVGESENLIGVTDLDGEDD